MAAAASCPNSRPLAGSATIRQVTLDNLNVQCLDYHYCNCSCMLCISSHDKHLSLGGLDCLRHSRCRERRQRGGGHLRHLHRRGVGAVPPAVHVALVPRRGTTCPGARPPGYLSLVAPAPLPGGRPSCYLQLTLPLLRPSLCLMTQGTFRFSSFIVNNSYNNCDFPVKPVA